MADNYIAEMITGGVLGAAAIWKTIPIIKRIFSRGKKNVIIEMPIADFFQALKDNSDFTIKRMRLEDSVLKKQKLDAHDLAEIITTEFGKAYERAESSIIKDEYKTLKQEFENALECVLLKMRRDLYDMFEKNHFVERDNWQNFVNNISESIYMKLLNEFQVRFKKCYLIPDLEKQIEPRAAFLKDQIETVLHNAKGHILSVAESVELLKTDQENHMKTNYIIEEKSDTDKEKE